MELLLYLKFRINTDSSMTHVNIVFGLLYPVAYRGGVWGVQIPPEILKALQNCAKLNPIVKTVKNCRI